MSLAIDLGLFLRNSKTKLGLSLTHRGVLFALAMRVGNNSATWIHQETLAHELNIDVKNLQDHLNKTHESGITLAEKQKADKRKNQYKFHPAIVNYHLLPEEERIKVHKIFGDEYCPPKGPKLSTGKKKSGAKSPPNSEDRGRNHPLNRGRNHPLNQEAETDTALQVQGLQQVENSPKATVQSNKEKQSTKLAAAEPGFKTACPITDDFILSKEAIQIAAQKQINIISVLNRFKEYARQNGWMSSNWQNVFLKWINKERAESVQRTTNTINERKSTEQFWGPGHPAWESLHGGTANA